MPERVQPANINGFFTVSYIATPSPSEEWEAFETMEILNLQHVESFRAVKGQEEICSFVFFSTGRKPIKIPYTLTEILKMLNGEIGSKR